MPVDVIVVGAGIAGLSCAWRLAAGGKKVILLEAQPQPGGNVRTERVDGYRFERGPHTFMGSADDIFTLAAEARIEEQIAPTLPSGGRRFIALHNAIHAIPSGPISFLTSPLLSFKGKLDLVAEPLRTCRGQASDTAKQFFDRRFGPEASRVLAGAFISGVYAGDPSILSAPAAFPLFWRFEQERGGMIRGMLAHGKQRKAERRARGDLGPRRKGLFSFQAGLGQLSAAVAAGLGERVRTNAGVQSIRRDNGCFVVKSAAGELRSLQLVVAVPPAEAGRLLAPLDAELGATLNAIPMAPVAVVHLGYPAGASAVPDGFGFLAPREEGVRTLGVLFPSRLFEGRAPAGADLLSGYVGGMLDPGALALDDGELVATVRSDLKRLTGLKQEAGFTKVLRFPAAIPQLTLGHLERMERIQARLGELPGLTLAGNYLRGVAMKDAVISGFEAAARILASTRPAAATRLVAATRSVAGP